MRYLILFVTLFVGIFATAVDSCEGDRGLGHVLGDGDAEGTGRIPGEVYLKKKKFLVY